MDGKIHHHIQDSSNKIVKDGNVLFYLKTENYDALVGFVTADENVKSWPDNEELKIDGKAASSDTGQAFTIQPNGDGQAFVYLSGTIPDTVDVDFYDGPAEAESGKGRLIDSIEIEIQVGKGGKLTLVAQNDEDEEYDEKTEEIGEDITLVATVVDNVGDPLEDVTVVFQKRYEGGSWVTIGQVETDDDGIAELDVEETRAGSYKYKAYLSTDKKGHKELDFNWEVAKIAKIVAKTADGTKIAVDEEYDLEFYLYDASGYLIKGNDDLAVNFIVVDQPEDGDIDDEDGITDITDTDKKSDGIVKISITPAEVGTYEFKLRSAKKTVYDTVTIKVQEYGTTEDMEISLADDKPSVTYGADEFDNDELTEDGVLDVKLIDEEGVKKQAETSNLSFGSSNRDVVKLINMVILS